MYLRRLQLPMLMVRVLYQFSLCMLHKATSPPAGRPGVVALAEGSHIRLPLRYAMCSCGNGIIHRLSGASAKSIVEYGASAEEVPHGVTYWPYDC
jgi:hypothetical protein